MARWLALLLSAALAGCIQVQVPTAPPPAAEGQAPDEDPSSYLVTCRLLDENATPVRDGTCEYRFGTLGARVTVDANGTAARRVAAGAAGTLAGSAPGRAGAQASLTVTNDKNVRMTLPLLPKARPGAAAPAADGNGTAAANQTQEADAFVNSTVYSGSVRDLVFRESYLMLPVEALATYSFDLKEGYQTLEFNGFYPAIAYAGSLHVVVRGPDGAAVLDYTEPTGPVPGVAVGDRVSEFPLGFWMDPKPGTYTVTIDAAGLAQFQLDVFGLAGLAPDFEFTTFPDGTERRLSDYAGRVVIVDLMAAWCGPCNDAMPDLAAVRKEYAGKVEILSVDVSYDDSGNPDTPQSDTPEDLQEFIERHDVDWPIGPDSSGERSAWSRYGTGYIPTMVLVDQHGGLIYRHIGSIDPAELRERIDAALAR